MAGFSNVPGMVSKEQVLAWTSSLYHELRHNGIDLSFGVCVESPTEWKVDVGFLDDVRRLYVADDTYHKFGYAPRSRVIGDPLIVVARLLELAKRTQFPIAFADSIGGDRCDDRLTRCLQRHGSIEIANLSALLDTLGPEKKEWLRRKNIKPYGIRFHTV